MIFQVAVKELNSEYHYRDVEQLTRFLEYCNLSALTGTQRILEVHVHKMRYFGLAPLGTFLLQPLERLYLQLQVCKHYTYSSKYVNNIYALGRRVHKYYLLWGFTYTNNSCFEA